MQHRQCDRMLLCADDLRKGHEFIGSRAVSVQYVVRIDISHEVARVRTILQTVLEEAAASAVAQSMLVTGDPKRIFATFRARKNQQFEQYDLKFLFRA